MSFAKAVDLLRLAMMATNRTGVCLMQIEEEFGCVRRTAQRMIDALEMAFPALEHRIGTDGRHYWSLRAAVTAQLLHVSADELASMSSAIAELERVGMRSEAKRLTELNHKVRALIPSERSARLATDEEAVLEAMGYAARPGPRPSLDPEVDEAISMALKGPFLLKISYKSRGDAKASARTIEPYGMLLGARRYLVAVDTAKRDGRFRHYRVEDISRAELLPESFAIPDDFSLADYAQKAFGSFHNDREFAEVVWKFAPHAADRVSGYQFHPSQEVEVLDDGSTIVRFKASGQLEMAWHLYAWGDAVEVLEPEALADLVNPHRRSDFPALP
ncbi:helix-turn-helix transcriptional regulator [Qipengyuania xiapuensis]|uniref:helix-turn-helix transcriptional regulator n=1 Tax=Qipengyuania xiapuensis TaxID=2867236 RepID=UPI001FFC516C|nr:WYL domain-containing protein [Qipengyuania xiapuensis]